MPWLCCGRLFPSSCLAVRVVVFFTYDRRVKEGRPETVGCYGARRGIVRLSATGGGMGAGGVRFVSSVQDSSCFTRDLGACRVRR